MGGKSKWMFFTKNPNLKYKKKFGWGWVGGVKGVGVGGGVSGWGVWSK